MAPILTTARLVLLPPDPLDDLEGLAALYADPVVYRRLGGRPVSREEVWRRLLAYHAHWQVMGYGNWSVRRRTDRAFIGSVGIFESRRDIVPRYEGTPEAGWVVDPALHGNGYAGEALAAMFAWADARPIPRTMCIIDAANTPSIRLAQRFGYRPLGTAIYREAPTNLYERTHPSAA